MGNSFLTPQSNSTFINQITDQGSGAYTDIAFWQVQPNNGFYYLGLYAVNNYNNPPQGFQMTYQANNLDNKGACLVAPTGFSTVWVCGGNGGNCWLGIYAPIAPPGYIALGCVASSNFYTSPPQLSDFPGLMCVRQDLCTQVVLTVDQNLIYADHGDGCYDDVTVFMLPNSQTPYAVSGYPNSVVAYDVAIPGA